VDGLKLSDAGDVFCVDVFDSFVRYTTVLFAEDTAACTPRRELGMVSSTGTVRMHSPP